MRICSTEAAAQGTTAQQITDPNANSKQINIKIDHNFNAKHKAAFNYTYQRDDSDANISSWPDGPPGSTCPAAPRLYGERYFDADVHIVNEARFGMNRNYNSTVPAYLSPDGGPNPAGEQYLLPGGQSLLNPSYYVSGPYGQFHWPRGFCARVR